MPDMESNGYNLSPTEAAEILHVHEETLKTWARKGKIRSFVTPGGWRKFSRADIDAFIADRTQEVSETEGAA